jgi:hypothetical protein
MTTHEELVSLRKAFAAPAGPAPEPETCPPPDRIWLAVRGELPPAELRTVLDHIAACPACAEDWRIAMAFEEESRAGAAIPAVPRRVPSFATRFRPWLVAAAMILTTTGGLLLYPHKDPPGYRGDGTTVESLVPQDASKPRDQFVLSWKPIPGATSYKLTVTEPSTMNLLFEKEDIVSTSFKLPESALTPVPSGAKLLWQVFPAFPDGSHPQEPAFTVRVR